RIGSTVVLNDSTLRDTMRTLTLPGASEATLRVRARNARGWGAWSSVVRFSSLPVPGQVVHVVPTDLSVAESVTTVLRWRRGNNGADSYRVRVTALSGSGVFDTTVTDTMLTVRLVAGESYSWTVNARNASGVSAWSAPWIFHSAALPDQAMLITPRNDVPVVTDTALLVWHAAAPMVRRYHVELREDGVVIMSDSAVTDTVRTVRHGDATTRLAWRVRAWNHWGWGPWSETFTYRHVTTPGVVTQHLPVDSARVPSRDVVLRWSVPRGVPTAYDVQIAGDTDTALTSTSDTVFSTRLPMSATWQRWRVRARNEAGSGPWSMWRVIFLRDTASWVEHAESAYPDTEECAFTVFPNPSAGTRMLRSDRERHVLVTLTDVTGRVLHQQFMDIGPEAVVVQLPPAAPGLTFLRVGTCIRTIITY
ncbi:MAG: fibronectin type III domain-containing protein, partial [Candidatus Kapaibacterium sp.]